MNGPPIPPRLDGNHRTGTAGSGRMPASDNRMQMMRESDKARDIVGLNERMVPGNTTRASENVSESGKKNIFSKGKEMFHGKKGTEKLKSSKSGEHKSKKQSSSKGGVDPSSTQIDLRDFILQQANKYEWVMIEKVLTQLEKECRESENLQSTSAANHQLITLIDKLISRVDWKGDEERDQYQMDLDSKRKQTMDSMQLLRDDNRKLRTEILALKAEQDNMAAGAEEGLARDARPPQGDMRDMVAREDADAALKQKDEEWQIRIRELQEKHSLEMKDAKLEMRKKAEHEKVMLRAYEQDEAHKRHEKAISSLNQDLEAVKQQHAQRIAIIKSEQAGQIASLKNDLATKIWEHQGNIEKIHTDHGYQLKQREREHESRIQRLRIDHDNELQGVTQSLESKIREMEDDHANELKSVRAQWNQKYKNTIQELDDVHEAEIRDVESKRDEAVRKSEQLLEVIDKMKIDQKEELQELKANLDARRMELEAQAKKDEAALQRKYEQREADLVEKHEKETQQLRKDRDAYSAALLERDKVRDKVEYLRDVQITAKFGELARDVELLAQSDWKSASFQSHEKYLRRLSNPPPPIGTPPTTLMRYLLQYSIWVVLHEYIFCSPFRVFGDEGLKLEKEWLKDFNGPDPAFANGAYTWPTPEVDTERWRFGTVKECRASLRRKASVYDPSAILKKSFADKRDELRSKLNETLGEVVDVDKGHVSLIEKLTLKATNVWLEFSMQQYRILIVIPGGKAESIENRILQAQTSSLDLVLTPKLKSYGNSKGQDLGVEQIIGGFDGEIIKVGGTSKPPLSGQRSERRSPSRRNSISQPRLTKSKDTI